MSTNSFVLYKGESKVNLNEMALRLSGCSSPALFSHKSFSIAFNSDRVLENYSITKNWHIWQLTTSVNNHIGKLSNKNILNLIIKKEVSISNFNYSFIAYNEIAEQLFVFNSTPGFLPIYYRIEQDEFWITSELKTFILNPYFDLELQPFSYVLSKNYMSENENAEDCIIKDTKRLLTDHCLTISDNDLQIENISHSKTCYQLKPEALIADNLFDILNKQLVQINSIPEAIGLTLSGGYDSGSMAGILSHVSNKTKSFTIGTKEINEFDDAALIANHFNLSNQQSIISENEYINAYLQSLYFNEINDSVVAEAYPTLYQSYKFSSGFVNHLCLGYGADIIIGNILNSEEDKINIIARNFLQRTATTGELSPFLADHFGLQTYSPFLSRELIDFCLSIPSHFKQKHGLNKYIQRLMILNHDLLPAQLIDQKKKALHDGAGIPNLFSKILKVSNDDDITKKRFLYLVWEQLFIKGKTVGECDVDQLIDKSKLIAI